MQMFWNYSQYNFSYIFHLVNSSHKNTLHFYFQLDCKVIVDLSNFFYCVDQGQHWATQEGHLIKLNIHINNGQKPDFECSISNHLPNQEEHKDHFIEEVCSF